MIARRKPLTRSPIKRRAPKRKKGENKDYIAWLHTLRCLIDAPECEWFRLEAAHVGIRGLGQKCPDSEAVLLCEWHHRTGPEAAHVLGKNFWSHHGIDRDAVLAQHHVAYTADTGKEI